MSVFFLILDVFDVFLFILNFVVFFVKCVGIFLSIHLVV